MAQRKNRKPTLGCGMQTLEDRRLMAGDVSVQFLGGDLHITGDNASNSITVSEVDNQIRVSGRYTTINGSTSPYSRNMANVDDILIDMNGGHDSVTVNNVNLDNYSHSDLVIDTDHGRDVVGIFNTDVRDDLIVRSGVDDDKVTVSYTDVVDNIYVNAGDGKDEIDVYRVTAGDDLDVFGDKGDDDVAIQRSSAADNLDVDLGEGKDVFWASRVTAPELNIYAGTGDDRVTLDRATVSDKLFADMGSGNDHLILTNNVSFGYRAFHGGSGSDTLSGWGNNFNPWSHDNSF